MVLKNRGSGLFALSSAFLLVALVTRGAKAQPPTEISIQRLSAETEAQHQIEVRAEGGNLDVDYAEDYATGTDLAVADTRAVGDKASATAVDPNAHAEGSAMNFGQAGFGSGRTTGALCYRLFDIGAQEPEGDIVNCCG